MPFKLTKSIQYQKEKPNKQSSNTINFELIFVEIYRYSELSPLILKSRGWNLNENMKMKICKLGLYILSEFI